MHGELRSLVLVLTIVGFLNGTARAIDDSAKGAARALANEAKRDYDAGRFEEAGHKFQRAYEVAKVPTLALWAARSLAKQGQLVAASELYRQATRLTANELWIGDAQQVAQADAARELAELQPLIPVAPSGGPRYATFADPHYAAPTVRGPPAPVRQSAVAAAAQRGNKRLAVLEFQGKSLDQDVLMTFSDTVRGGALQGLEGRGVVVMTRENMLVLLRDMGKKECGEGECEVETARNIGADYVVSGKVVRMEQIYVVTLKLHETQGGSLIGTDTVEAASQVELLRALRERARLVINAAFGPRPGSR